jgi:hypothetical protein
VGTPQKGMEIIKIVRAGVEGIMIGWKVGARVCKGFDLGVVWKCTVVCIK